MKISLQWLRDYVDVPETAEELAELLTMAGLEVSAIEMRGADIDDVVVAQIEEKGQHPDADRLSLCRVTDGSESYPIVCGATSSPGSLSAPRMTSRASRACSIVFSSSCGRAVWASSDSTSCRTSGD